MRSCPAFVVDDHYGAGDSSELMELGKIFRSRQDAPCCLLRRPESTGPVRWRWCWVSETVEIAIGSLCSVVTWEYTVQNETARLHDGLPGQRVAEKFAEDSIIRPSPGFMLLSCLVFGCCVSSFAHRRQNQDPFQFVVYTVLLGVAALVGYRVGASVYLILLGYLPWATCAAMAISISGHSLYRWLKGDVGPSRGDEEKAQLVG